MRAQELPLMARKAIEDKQAEHIRLLDLRRLTPFFNWFLLCTAGNSPHIKAVDEAVSDALAAVGRKIERREGTPESGWVVLDFGDIIVHIFSPEMREFYNLDMRWDKAPEVVGSELNS